MTDQSGDRPGGRSERPLPARRAPSEPAPGRSADRFTAPRQTRTIGGLTSERAAKIVRQSADARWVAFLGMVVVALFVIVYYFYELGVPILNTTPRLEAQDQQQQVTAVERGYNLYQANCASCHGVNGEGGIGPILNDQSKLFKHLDEQYLKNVLTVGGRLVCGNAKSIMPVWADTNGGPLNYIQIEDLIAFLRAPSTQEYTRRDHEFNEPIIGADGKVLTFKGWRDTTYKPDPSATPVPACYKGDVGSATPAPQATLSPDATILEITAVGIAFDKKELTAPAGVAFGIRMINNDPAPIDHDVDIRSTDSTTVFVNNVTIQQGVITYTIPPLEAGTYTFICSVHPIPAMTGTLTVE